MQFHILDKPRDWGDLRRCLSPSPNLGVLPICKITKSVYQTCHPDSQKAVGPTTIYRLKSLIHEGLYMHICFPLMQLCPPQFSFRTPYATFKGTEKQKTNPTFTSSSTHSSHSVTFGKIRLVVSFSLFHFLVIKPLHD